MFRLSRTSGCGCSATKYSFSHLTYQRQLSPFNTQIQNQSEDREEQKLSQSTSLLSKSYTYIQQKHGADAIRAPSIEYNRWLQVVPPVATMLCLGGMYSWSLYNGPLTHSIGIITQVASDWSLSSVVPVFGTLVFFNGTAGAVLGKWIDKSGPRIAYGVGGLMYGGGMCLGALGVSIHSLPLLYGGFGVIGGLGHGICYISCVSTLIQFFPDKRGLASGMALMGLGGGAILATPVIDRLLTSNFRAPMHLDENVLSSAAISINGQGQSMIDISQITHLGDSIHALGNNDNLLPIAKLDVSDLLSSGFSSKIMSTLVDGGTYIVGTGSTGAAATLMTVGGAYLATILTSALFTKLPHRDFNPLAAMSTKGAESKEAYSMSVEEAMRTPQFWAMWCAFCALSSTGMGCISTAKTMMSEVFGGSLPLIVTSSFASTYVMAISASNLAGRLGWGYVSDRIGQFPTYTIFGVTGCVLYASVPFYVASVVDTPSMAPLAMFYASTLFCFSYFGGGFSVMPSYEATLFGPKNIGAIHGRMMTGCAVSGFVGPMIVTRCRESKYKQSIKDLAEYVNADEFMNEFGASLNELDRLVEDKVVTINKMMQLIPDGMAVVDPTPFLYDSTMYAMSGCMAICAIGNMVTRKLGMPKQMMQNSK